MNIVHVFDKNFKVLADYRKKIRVNAPDEYYTTFRNYTVNQYGSIDTMSDSLVNFKKFPYMTIVYEMKNSLIRYAVAICNPNDSFNKKIGVKLASERFESGDVEVFDLCQELNSNPNLQTLVRKLYKNLPYSTANITPDGTKFLAFKDAFLDKAVVYHYIRKMEKTEAKERLFSYGAQPDRLRKRQVMHHFNRNDPKATIYSFGASLAEIKGFTLAYIFEGKDHIRVSGSICHKQDYFSKMIGRELAVQRLSSDETSVVFDATKYFYTDEPDYPGGRKWYECNDVFNMSARIPAIYLQNDVIRQLILSWIHDGGFLKVFDFKKSIRMEL